MLGADWSKITITHTLDCDWLAKVGWCVHVINMPCLGTISTPKDTMHATCVICPSEEVCPLRVWILHGTTSLATNFALKFEKLSVHHIKPASLVDFNWSLCVTDWQIAADQHKTAKLLLHCGLKRETTDHLSVRLQWLIQDFPGAPIPEGGTKLLFGITFPENYMKMKKMDREVHASLNFLSVLSQYILYNRIKITDMFFSNWPISLVNALRSPWAATCSRQNNSIMCNQVQSRQVFPNLSFPETAFYRQLTKFGAR